MLEKKKRIVFKKVEVSLNWKLFFKIKILQSFKK
jgi:hypothetical protein